ncbi:MAG: hypothetical protein AAF685_12355 [Cyanobacteria bacterium P01_C01_bin.89]
MAMISGRLWGDRSSSFFSAGAIVSLCLHKRTKLIFAIGETKHLPFPPSKQQTETAAINSILEYRLLYHIGVVAPSSKDLYLSLRQSINTFWLTSINRLLAEFFRD